MLLRIFIVLSIGVAPKKIENSTSYLIKKKNRVLSVG